MSSDGKWRWLVWLIVGAGGILVVGALALGLGSLRYVLQGVPAVGDVVEVRRDGDSHLPVLRFPLPGDEMQTVTGPARGAPDIAVGDRVELLYMPYNPRDVRIATFDRLWVPAAITMLSGVFGLLVGGVAWSRLDGLDLAAVGEAAFIFLAAAAGLIGVFILWSAADLYTGGVRAEGTVVAYRELRSDGTSSAPVVRFTTGEGREVELLGHGGNARPFAVGERVTVVHDAAHPGRARIVSFTDIWRPAAVAFAVALAFGAAVWLARRLRRRPKVLRA